MQRHIPMGYRMKDGEMCFDEERAKIVKKAFSDYLSGISTHAIAKELTANGVLNANNKPSWNHGSVGRLLENIRYLGDEMYPQMIETEIFEQVQSRRKEQRQKLGRGVKPNSVNADNPFTDRLRCGECGEVFRKYTENLGKPLEKSKWKCKKSVYGKQDRCNCESITDEKIKETFTLAISKVKKMPHLLDKKPKEPPKHYNLEFLKLDQRIKELESSEQFSSKELSVLIFQRASAFYQTAQVHDYEHHTEKMKGIFADEQLQTEFQEELFSQTIKQMVIYADRHIDVEFINGLTVHGCYKNTKKEDETYANKKREEHNQHIATSRR